MTEIKKLFLKDDGSIPNNRDLPVILYKGVFREKPDTIEKTFNENNWTNSWQGDVFDYHHYHSNTHEVLGVRSGSAVILLGGEEGEKVTAEMGDVAVLPAGTGHKKLSGTEDFQIVGAYPGGLTPNKKIGEPGERPYVLEEIAEVPLPKHDPVYGSEGPIQESWK